jgi:uncharacterized glyoxalase superfamily protein PhnB
MGVPGLLSFARCHNTSARVRHRVGMPLSEGPWGGVAAWLTDRFGINWNLDLEPE